MTDGVSIPYERLVDGRVGDLEKRLDLKIASVRAEFKLELRATETAKKLQATEYERRLLDLNNSHAIARDVANTFATKEIVEREIRLLAERIAKLELARADRDAASRIIWAMWGAGVMLIVALIGYAASRGLH